MLAISYICEEANSKRKSKQDVIRNNLTTQNQPLIFYTLTSENEKTPTKMKNDADAQNKESNLKSKNIKKTEGGGGGFYGRA